MEGKEKMMPRHVFRCRFSSQNNVFYMAIDGTLMKSGEKDDGGSDLRCVLRRLASHRIGVDVIIISFPFG